VKRKILWLMSAFLFATILSTLLMPMRAPGQGGGLAFFNTTTYPNLQPVAGDIMIFAHAGIARTCTINQLGNSSEARVTSDVTNATGTMANLSDLTLTLGASTKYVGRLVLFANNSTPAEGLQFDFNGGTATVTSIEFGFIATPPGSGLALGTLTSTAIGTPLTATTATTADAVYVIEIGIAVNAAGTFIPRVAEVSHNSGTATVRKQSYLWLQQSSN